MTCPICASWTQPANCGHGFDNGVPMPSGWFTPTYVATIELGSRVGVAMRHERGRGADRRIAARASKAAA